MRPVCDDGCTKSGGVWELSNGSGVAQYCLIDYGTGGDFDDGGMTEVIGGSMR